MRDYAKVIGTFWTGETGKKIRDLGREAQVLALYLMTAPSSNMTGLYYLPLPTVAHETGIPLPKASETIRQLVGEGFLVHDEESEYVFVIEMARFQIGESLSLKDNRRISVVRELRAAKTCLVDLFLDRYRTDFNLEESIYPTVTHDRMSDRMLNRLCARDGGKCKECGALRDLSVDHVIAKINGGRKELSNLQILCVSCNAKKAAIDRRIFWDRLGRGYGAIGEESPTAAEVVPDGLPSQEQEQEHEHIQEQEHTQTPPAGDAMKPEPSNPKNQTTKSLPSVEAYELSNKLLAAIKTRDPGTSKGGNDSARWARDIDLLIRVDGRKPEQIADVIAWCQTGAGSWWGPVVMSGKKLREKFDELWGQMTRASPSTQDRDEEKLRRARAIHDELQKPSKTGGEANGSVSMAAKPG